MSTIDEDYLQLFLWLVCLLIMCIIAVCVGVTDQKSARRILQADGVEAIEFTGWKPLSCGNGDWYRTGFTGIKNGKRINGVVCEGLLFKGSTVRYF